MSSSIVTRVVHLYPSLLVIGSSKGRIAVNERLLLQRQCIRGKVKMKLAARRKNTAAIVTIIPAIVGPRRPCALSPVAKILEGVANAVKLI